MIYLSTPSHFLLYFIFGKENAQDQLFHSFASINLPWPLLTKFVILFLVILTQSHKHLLGHIFSYTLALFKKMLDLPFSNIKK